MEIAVEVVVLVEVVFFVVGNVTFIGVVAGFVVAFGVHFTVPGPM